MNTSLTVNRIKRRAVYWGAHGKKLLALVLLIAGSISLPTFALNTGDAFPDLSKYDLEGTLPETKGKVVLVDFFASWCVPCRASFPAMEDIYEKYKDKGLVIIAVNVDKRRGDMESFIKKHPSSFTIMRDASTRLVSQVKVATMPSSFLMNKDGKVVAVHNGFYGEDSKRKYIEEIEALLK